jgi:hypothetical protein
MLSENQKTYLAATHKEHTSIAQTIGLMTKEQARAFGGQRKAAIEEAYNKGYAQCCANLLGLAAENKF